MGEVGTPKALVLRVTAGGFTLVCHPVEVSRRLNPHANTCAHLRQAQAYVHTPRRQGLVKKIL